MLYGGTINLHYKEGIVPPFRLFRKQPLDLVASQIADLRQRAETAADIKEPFRHLVASGGWCAPSEVSYGLLDLPEIGVRRGGIKPRPAPDTSWIDMGPIND